MTQYTHEQVLDGARGVWALDEWVAVWQGGRTLNVYEDRAGGWTSVRTKQFMEQPDRERVAETAAAVLQEVRA